MPYFDHRMFGWGRVFYLFEYLTRLGQEAYFNSGHSDF
jgi:hypothetical protein